MNEFRPTQPSHIPTFRLPQSSPTCGINSTQAHEVNVSVRFHTTIVTWTSSTQPISRGEKTGSREGQIPPQLFKFTKIVDEDA